MTDTVKEVKKFEPSSETIDGFLVSRKHEDYVEIGQDGEVLGKIRGDINDQAILDQISRIKYKQLRQL